MNRLVSIDPGTHKCGLILADIEQGNVIDGRVVHSSLLIKLLDSWSYKHSFSAIILGNGTNSNYLVDILKDIAPINIVDETGSTLRARKRYWEIIPPKGFMSFIPKSLLFPPKELDAFAALILLEDFIGKKLIWNQNISTKI